MSKKLEWAEEYLQKVSTAKERAVKEFQKSGELSPEPLFTVPSVTQAWLEELARAIVADESAPKSKRRISR